MNYTHTYLQNLHYIYFYSVNDFNAIDNNSGDFIDNNDINKRLIGFEGSQLRRHFEFIEEKYSSYIDSLERNESIISIPEIAISIVPFNYYYRKEQIVENFIKVISNNEEVIKSRSIGFPLMQLSSATNNKLQSFGQDTSKEEHQFELAIKSEWCCFGHLYLHSLKQALKEKEYFSPHVNLDKKFGNIVNVDFEKSNGYNLSIHADAGL